MKYVKFIPFLLAIPICVQSIGRVQSFSIGRPPVTTIERRIVLQKITNNTSEPVTWYRVQPVGDALSMKPEIIESTTFITPNIVINLTPNKPYPLVFENNKGDSIVVQFSIPSFQPGRRTIKALPQLVVILKDQAHDKILDQINLEKMDTRRGWGIEINISGDHLQDSKVKIWSHEIPRSLGEPKTSAIPVNP